MHFLAAYAALEGRSRHSLEASRLPEAALPLPTRVILYLLQEEAAEDRLNDKEPPDWFFFIRHPLGHVLLQTGKYKDADATGGGAFQKGMAVSRYEFGFFGFVKEVR